MSKKKIHHKEVKKLVLKVVSDCKKLAYDHVRNWKPVDDNWPIMEGAVYLRLSDDAQVAVERGSLEQQIHIAISEAQYRSEQEKINYKITEFYIEPGVTGTHDNRPEFIRLQQNIMSRSHKFIIFKEISRLVRDLEIWKRFFKLCQTYDCEICLRGLPFNPNDPASILQLDQLAAFAEFESRTTSKRIKESNHSAMITSGKFNSDHPLLGFDLVTNKEGEGMGLYRPNAKEIKQVEWIMSAFLRADTYRTLLKWCRERNIKSKQGKDFQPTSLKALLTNTRYIGKWYRNLSNKDKRQSKLMPYERYTEVTLDYGCVVDKSLWDAVQKKIKDMDNSRSKGVKRCYPLSGLLTYEDGSRFVGNGAWGRSGRFNYYYNPTHGIRVKTEVFEEETKRILSQIVEDSKEFRKSVTHYIGKKKEALDAIKDQIQGIENRLTDLKDQKEQLDKRLNFLLEDKDPQMAISFKGEYKKQYLELKNQEEELRHKKSHLEAIYKQGDNAPNHFGKEKLGVINDALTYIRLKDLISFKSVCRVLFEKIVVTPLDEAQVQLEFVFRGMNLIIGIDEVKNCISMRLVEVVRL